MTSAFARRCALPVVCRWALAAALLSTAWSQQALSRSPSQLEWTSDDGQHRAIGYLASVDERRPSILVRAPALPDQLTQLAARQAGSGVNVILQATRLPSPSTASEWLAEQMASTGSTLEWIRAQPFSDGVVGLLTIGAAAASLGPASSVAPQAMVLIDAPATLAEIFCRNGLPRVGEAVAVVAAQERRTPQQVELDWSACALGTPLGPSSELDVPTVWIGGWYRPHSSSTIDGWRARSRAQLLLLTATDRPAASGGVDGRSEVLAHAFDRLGELLKSLESMTVTTGAQASSVDYEHQVAGSSASSQSRSTRRAARDWPPPCADCRTEAWYLRGSRALTLEMPGPEAPSSYRYDPSEPVYSIGGGVWHVTSLLSAPDRGHYELAPLELGPLDQRRIPVRSDYLRFRSAPLDAPLHLRGEVTVEAWVATDAPETAFVVKLVHSFPDGYQALLREQAVRAADMSYGIPKQLTIELGPIAYTVPAGHRIALHVTSSSWPNVARHPNVKTTAAQIEPSQPAHQTLYHDRVRPSALLLPVVSSPEHLRP